MVVDTGQGLRCAITNLAAFPLDCGAERRLRLERQVRQWAVDGVDIVQLREKGMETGELLSLAEAAMGVLREVSDGLGVPKSARRTRLLVNARADVAAAARADGVHLTSRPGELVPGQVRQVFAAAGLSGCLVSVSCHTGDEVVRAHKDGADFLLFGPVFEKQVGNERIAAGVGTVALREACRLAGATPVLALGGITAENAPACMKAGAAGIAGIRLFAW